MVLTFWGCSKCTAFFIGDASQPRVIKRGLAAVNYFLLVGTTILAAYSFMLLHQIFHDFTITVAMIMAFIVMFVTAIAMVYKLWQICNSQEEHFTLKVQGTWTKVSKGSWVKLKDQEVTQAMLTSDHYIHSRKRGGRSIIGQGVIAASMLAAGDSGVNLQALRYVTSVVRNPGGPQGTIHILRNQDLGFSFPTSVLYVIKNCHFLIPPPLPPFVISLYMSNDF